MEVVEIKHSEGNATFAVEEALQKLVPGKPALIRFEKGIYHFQREGSRTGLTIKAGYLRDARKYVLFALEGLSDVTIDGNGSEFIFMDRMFPFFLRNCRNVTLKNFTIDFSFSMFTQGTVLSSGKTGFEMKIDRSLFKYSVDGSGHVTFYCGSDSFSTGDPEWILLGNAQNGLPPWDIVFAGSTKAPTTNLPTGCIWTDAEETAEGVFFRYRKDSKILDLPAGSTLFFNYMPRENVNILAQMCQDIRVENIVMYRGGGMGIVAEYTRNFTVDGACIMVKPGRTECRSTTADGMFITQCSGEVVIRNSKVADTLDDAFNIHGFYSHIAEINGDKLVLRYLQPTHYGPIPYAVGDKLMICDPETQKFKAYATIASAVEEPAGTCTVTLKEFPSDLSLQAGDLVENETQTADLLYENNELVRVPHLRFSDNGKIRIRNNRFDKILSLYFCDLIAMWYESGVVCDVLVENNEFIDSSSGEEYAVFIESHRKPASDVRHKNIRVLNNRFTGGPGKIAKITWSDHVTFSGNQFTAVDGVEPIVIENSTDVKIE